MSENNSSALYKSGLLMEKLKEFSVCLKPCMEEGALVRREHFLRGRTMLWDVFPLQGQGRELIGKWAQLNYRTISEDNLLKAIKYLRLRPWFNFQQGSTKHSVQSYNGMISVKAFSCV
ncbi:hypothetical protein GOODEAATRI_008327 [Goodea atripinnis]|uniref:Uncharacterized protein n=1 Tax=Goodea atripinnis TaxID=208336 RepID=A0ABV0PCF6_9TELE